MTRRPSRHSQKFALTTRRPAKNKPTPQTQIDLADDMARFFADPLGFVKYAFPWGKGELAFFEEPEAWQAVFLKDLGASVAQNNFQGIGSVAPLRMSAASGHGIGKSALTAWLILWIMSTRPHSKGVVTANTGPQLETKTWAELAKWRKRCITGHWFDITTSKGNMKLVSLDHPATWRVDAQTCREENSEAFAGQHAAGSTSFYIFDEASAVPDIIWEVAEGGLTDGEPMIFAFGNPTRNSGKFRECFGRQKHRWQSRQIDSREVKFTNKKLLQEWVDDYGEDSDFVRVRVRGVFPRAGTMQFIPADLVRTAMQRIPEPQITDSVVIGVDVARFGDDQSVIFVRKGRDAKNVKPLTFRGIDTVALTQKIIEAKNTHKADAIFVDGGGVGGGVVDQLRHQRHTCFDINFGSRAGNPRYQNMRAQMWGNMRDWLKVGAIPDHPEIENDLTGVEYGYVGDDNRIQLEKKADMKKRGLSSPDLADALALTFAYPIAPKSLQQALGKPNVSEDPDPYR
jgi:hypothetical protein